MDIHKQLIAAAKKGDLNQVVLCIENGANPKLWNSQALSEATIHNHFEIVKSLTPLSDVNVDCAVGLRNAFLHNNTDILNFLWDRVDHGLIIEHAQYMQRPTPFQLACQYGFYQHALSLLKYPMRAEMFRRSLFSLPKVSNDPLCLTLIDKILTHVKDLGEDPAHFAASSWHERPLPGLNILKIMAQHSSTTVSSAQRFLECLAKNWASENHISAIFQVFDHVFDDFDADAKKSIVAKTIAYDPTLAHSLIERSRTTQLLCADVVKEALRADMDTLMYMINVWKTHPYVEDENEREFALLESSLRARIYDTPEKVWCVIEHFKQFLTSNIIHKFIEMCDDKWTERVCAHSLPEKLLKARSLFNNQTRDYFNEYQYRVQRATLNQELSAYTGATVVRKI